MRWHARWPSVATETIGEARITEDGGYWLRSTFGEGSILGWVVQTEDDGHAETFLPPDPKLFAVRDGFVAERGRNARSG